MKKSLKEKIKKYIILPMISIIEKHVYLYRFYQNINLNLLDKNQKRVLISYITEPMEYNNQKDVRHTSIFESIQIIQTFISLGYCVDVIHCEDKNNLNLVKEKKYDIIFGLGDPYYIACKLNPSSLKIIYLTESAPTFTLKQEKERIDYFYKRHGIKAKTMRSELYFKNEHLNVSQYGILIGNDYTKRSYENILHNIFLLKPTGLFNPDYKLADRIYSETKKNFIWFGSLGAIHKGLDILIDIFANEKECTLYVCGLNPEERVLLSYKEKYNNIVDKGFINVNSDEYLKLVNTCSYVILPSCSEGMATSVLTCMNHGLIPIVTKEAGIDLANLGIEIPDYHVENAAGIVRKAASLDNEVVADMHQKVFGYSKEVFNLNRFANDFREILIKIIRQSSEKFLVK